MCLADMISRVSTAVNRQLLLRLLQRSQKRLSQQQRERTMMRKMRRSRRLPTKKKRKKRRATITSDSLAGPHPHSSPFPFIGSLSFYRALSRHHTLYAMCRCCTYSFLLPSPFSIFRFPFSVFQSVYAGNDEVPSLFDARTEF